MHYDLEKAVEIVKDSSTVNFDETVDLAINLNVDPRHAEENIRITTALPNGTGKEVSVLVLAQGPKVQEAIDAGADFCGNKEYIDKIKGGWTDVDKIVATPDMMSELGKLGKILGPKGLMPNPKSGTVTMDVAKAVNEVKSGKIDFKVDKYGIVHASVAKASFDATKIADNADELIQTIVKLKPSSSKGSYIKSIVMSSTMGAGVKIDTKSF